MATTEGDAGACAAAAPRDDRPPVRAFQFVCGGLVGAVLVWQAAAACQALGRRVDAQARFSWRERLLDGTDDKLRRALGADAGLFFALRAAVPPGSLVVTQKVTGGKEDIERVQKDPTLLATLSARNGLLVQLTTLLYPDPFLYAAPDPITVVEQVVAGGNDALLCVLPGDRTPAGRPGWSRTGDNPGFETWRYRKG